MYLTKILKDYAKTPLEKELNDYLSNKLDSTICYEKITNREFMIKYIQPINDFVIYTTSIPCCDVKRMF